MIISKIVITGGPCGGKTCALARIKEHFTKLGYTVIPVAETATELISSGITPTTCRTGVEYQKFLLRLQLQKEKIYTQAAESLPDERVMIVYDRGALDGKAYMSDSDFSKLLSCENLSETKLLAEYDAVFHLVSAAKGAVEHYTLKNNDARTETPEQAALLDDKCISAWSSHPNFMILDNSTGFDEKINRLLSALESLLG